MQELVINDTAAELILTLTEAVTIDSPNYLFVFTHTTTKRQVAFIKGVADDLSAYQGRFNKFTIDAQIVFGSSHPGWWTYNIYQQASASNLDPDQAEGLLESGKMLLKPVAGFEFNKYDSPTTYKVYNG